MSLVLFSFIYLRCYGVLHVFRTTYVYKIHVLHIYVIYFLLFTLRDSGATFAYLNEKTVYSLKYCNNIFAVDQPVIRSSVVGVGGGAQRRFLCALNFISGNKVLSRERYWWHRRGFNRILLGKPLAEARDRERGTGSWGRRQLKPEIV